MRALINLAKNELETVQILLSWEKDTYAWILQVNWEGIMSTEVVETYVSRKQMQISDCERDENRGVRGVTFISVNWRSTQSEMKD